MGNEILDNRGRGEATWHWPRIHPEAHKFAAIAAIASAAAAMFAWETLAWPLGFLVLGICAFFRDPVRVTPQDDRFIVAPADGLITLIQQVEPHVDRGWDELSPVEKAVLILGAHEMNNHLDIPYRVVINEAVELTKTFGGTDAHKFVNGVLDKVAANARAAEIRAQ